MTVFTPSSSSRRAAAALVLVSGLLAQGAMALPPADPPVAAPSMEAAVLAQAPVTEGRVTRLLINPYGEVDALLIADCQIVKLPPHLSDAVIAAARPGQSVRVFGLVEAPGSIKADAVVNLATGQVVFDRSPDIDGPAPLPPHLRAGQLRQLSVEGRVDLVLTGPRGETNGVVLDNGSVVRFAPDGLRSPLQRGAPFAATGLGTHNDYGTSIEAISVGASLGSLQQIYGRLR